ncbi:sporozoite surface protein 2 [Helicoverpa armigera]|uniref:sporozoite surface protein 2 n=1 Tax=Helicoverpa armigera TaxID=29058 RepID=UPI003082AE80
MCEITVDAAKVAKEINAVKKYNRTSTTTPRTTKPVTKSTIIRKSSTDIGKVMDTTTTVNPRDKIKHNTGDHGRDDGNHPRDTATDNRRDNANNPRLTTRGKFRDQPNDPRDTARENGRDNANNPRFTTKGKFRDQPNDPRDTATDNRRDNANNPRLTTRGNFGNHPRENPRDNARAVTDRKQESLRLKTPQKT